ncbi:hypothetical protein [Kineobactrum salinum]|uniref:Uncharacterized protein n=1 Tax=Kineobactrum salinum TaxID=2708301 RepID=A0A6C0TXT7_9GAMM|nr:hypothetical protein [Kineobactrum salinum]QIB64642.1 hypothetical protein G3T16_03745 [Kineobactrum salinum]
MKITIRESGKTETLSILDPDGTDFAVEFIRSTGALDDGQFDYEEESGTWTCSQDTYNKWAQVIRDNELLDTRLPALNRKYGTKTVNKVIGAAGNCRPEDFARTINSALDEAFGKQ